MRKNYCEMGKQNVTEHCVSGIHWDECHSCTGLCYEKDSELDVRRPGIKGIKWR